MSSMEPDERTRRENAMWCRMDARDIAANTAKQLADLQHQVQAAVMARVANVLAERYRDGVEWDAPIPAKAGPCSAADADMARWLLGKISEIERLVERAGVTAWAGMECGQDLASRGTTRSLAAIRAWAVDVETRATQADHTEGATMEENKGAREQLDEMRDAHNRALAEKAAEQKAPMVTTADIGRVLSQTERMKAEAAAPLQGHEAEKALRAAQIEPVEELLKDAACTAESMVEQKAANALWHVREMLSGEAAFATVIVGPEVPMPQTLPPWISPWEGDCARIIADKVGKALELLSQYEWVKNHPAKPAKSLERVHAWATEMYSSHLEHNQRAALERGRSALIEAQSYMREAVRMILRDNMTGEQALNYDRALGAVGDALVVVSDNVLRDKKPLERRPIEAVLTRRSAAMMAHRAISQWLYSTAESPFGEDGARRQDLPPEAKAAMYRAAWAIGHGVMRDSQSLSEIALGAARIVREHVAGWVRPARS